MEPEVEIHPLGSTPGIASVLPKISPNTQRCEVAVHIGVFFDGTGNNKDWDDADDCTVGQGTQASRRKESNVARLFCAYPDKPSEGYFRLYVSGVGTPFNDIGETMPATFGGAFGEGGDGRINYALLLVLNAIQASAYPLQTPAFSTYLAKALCRNGRRTQIATKAGVRLSSLENPSEDGPALRTVGMESEGGLLMDGLKADRSQARAFYHREAARIAELLGKATKPKPVEVFVDVFGFSRGAAEARVFCSWLSEIFQGDTLCGLPARIRFLGIFDTVASVGVPNNPKLTYGLTNGHMAWAQPQWLRIPERVVNCVHFVAMHENRPSFPLDRVWVNNGLPSNCHEYAFPGMHSDVGGGYGVREQGRGRLSGGKNVESSEKLSQIPLDYMAKAAKVAKVPLDIELAVSQAPELNGYNPYAVDSQLRSAFEAFHSACTPKSRQPADWLLTYLSWRYQVRNTYAELDWSQRASASDKDDLIGANDVLLLDIQALESNSTELVLPWVYDIATFGLVGAYMPESRATRLRKMAPEAGSLLQRIKAQATVSQAEATLFSTYCHDSYAGFRPLDHRSDVYIVGCQDLIPGSWEPEGYFRYRRFYSGFNESHTYKVALSQYEQDLRSFQSMVNTKGYGVGDVFGGFR